MHLRSRQFLKSALPPWTPKQGKSVLEFLKNHGFQLTVVHFFPKKKVGTPQKTTYLSFAVSGSLTRKKTAALNS